MWAYILAATRRERRRSLPEPEPPSDVFTLGLNTNTNTGSNLMNRGEYPGIGLLPNVYPSSSRQYPPYIPQNLTYPNSMDHEMETWNTPCKLKPLSAPASQFLQSSPARKVYNTADTQKHQRSRNSLSQSVHSPARSESRYETPSRFPTPHNHVPYVHRRGRSVPNLSESRWNQALIEEEIRLAEDYRLYAHRRNDGPWHGFSAATGMTSDNGRNLQGSSVQVSTNFSVSPAHHNTQRNMAKRDSIEEYGFRPSSEDLSEMIENGGQGRGPLPWWRRALRVLSGRRQPRERGVHRDRFLDKFSMRQTHHHHEGDKGEDEEGCCTSLVIDTSQDYHYRWLAVVSLAVLYNLVFVVGRAVFWELNNMSAVLWMTLDYTCDAIYLVDMLVHAHEGYLEQGLMVRSVSSLRLHYFRSVAWRWDLVSLFPTDLLYMWWPPAPCLANVPCAVIVRVNRLFRLPRMLEFFDRTETATGYPNAFRICKVVLAILVLIHWNACLYFAISYALGFGTDNWVYNLNGSRNSTLARQYIYSFYWSTLTLTTIGETPQPENDAEYLFVVADFLAGVLIFATIVGNIGSMISNMNVARVEFQNRMDGVKQYMAFRKVGGELEARVIRWFAYTWAQSGALDEERVLSALPDKLKAEIAIRVHLDTLRQVRIFQDCEPGLLEALVLKLRLQVFSPGDYICRKGDVGKEMYIVKRGKLTVVADDGKTVLATLSAGSVFGEVSVLEIAGNRTGNRRTANVRSSGYSDLFCLAKRDLWEALADYPDARASLTERGCQILRKDGLLDEDAFRGAQHTTESLETRVVRMQGMLHTVSARLARLTAQVASSQAKFKQRLNRVELRNPESMDTDMEPSTSRGFHAHRHNYSV